MRDREKLHRGYPGRADGDDGSLNRENREASREWKVLLRIALRTVDPEFGRHSGPGDRTRNRCGQGRKGGANEK